MNDKENINQGQNVNEPVDNNVQQDETNFYQEQNYLNDHQFQANNEQNPEEKKDDEKSPLYWVFIIIATIVIAFLIMWLLRCCNSTKKNKNEEILSTNEWVTNMWNNCVDPIYWYTVKGTGVNDSAIDIDETLNKCDTYYNEFNSYNEKVNNLDNSHKEFKEYYQKIKEQMEIIYPKIKADKPLPNVTVDYEENMDVFYENQKKLYDLVVNNYKKS